MDQQTGAIYTPGRGCRFTVWAPEIENMQLHIVYPIDTVMEMNKDDQGYFSLTTDAQPGYKYFFNANGKGDRPDPASFYQPDGVHGPSQVIDLNYTWGDNSWRGLTLSDYIIYELHIGTFTPEGTFEAAIAHLDDLKDTGINAIEIMPVGQFPGGRNWGYDGVYPYAAQNTYGGPDGLRKLVEACHSRGIAVILDVVYNHLGPEGNYISVYGPYFTDKYHTPWGDAVNFDRAWSDGVRSYFCNNALYWLHYFHIDALRLDAIHEMYDYSAIHFWEQLHYQVKELSAKNGRPYYLIAESDLNNHKIVKYPETGGYGFDAQWLDDFHHAMYVLLDAKGAYRYKDFGAMEQVAKAYTDGFVHSGEYVTFRKKKFGSSTAGLPGNRFVIFNQNHDQIGNTADGLRLSCRISQPLLRVAAAAILLAPYIPMLFMGEEYGETNPFTYFIEHSDKELIKAIQEGRKKEFAHERWDNEPDDPAAESTFNKCKLNWELREQVNHKELLDWHKRLIALRQTHAALRNYSKNDVRVYIICHKCFALHRKCANHTTQLLAIFNLSDQQCEYTSAQLPEAEWNKILESSITGDTKVQPVNLIPPESIVVYDNIPLQ